MSATLNGRTLVDASIGFSSSIVTPITASTAVGTLLATNPNRKGAAIHNDSSSILYLKLGTGAAANSYTRKMFADEYMEIPFSYTGIITGVWATATGTAYVTEIS
jgi:hypothetical protein